MPSALQPASEIPLQIGPHAVTLRASLRVAVALESLPGGIASLWDGVARQKITTLHAVIRAGATDRAGAERLLTHAATVPLVQFADTAQAACLALLSAILAPAEGEAEPATPSDPMPLSRFFTELFSLATSWLGWPPSEVWAASVAEIVTALEAQAERLAKMNPDTPSETNPAPAKTKDAPYTSDRLRQIEEQGFDPAFDREGLKRLSSKTRVY